jgi:hypothetical protein
MAKIDQRGTLAAEPFAFRITKDRKVLIQWNGKIITTRNGPDAEKLLARIATADRQQAQLLMARATGHFKRGNERPNSH